MNLIYLDNNASTPLLPEALEAMRPFLCERFGNPASSHVFGRQARKALEDAREKIAALLEAQPDEVVFTSGATEANNVAMFGLAGPTPARLVTSFLEHPSVLEPINELYRRGNAITYLAVTPDGVLDVGKVRFHEDTRLIAIMLANHETGAIQPIESLLRALSVNGNGRAAVHCDAAAAAGKMPISFRNLGVTTVTISAHKFHGPKGIGALLVRRGVKLHPLHFGGHQQHGQRPGTEPVALAVGMATALEWSLRKLDEHQARLLDLRQRFLAALREHAAPVMVNGPVEGGLPGTLNLSFPGCKADALLMNLDIAGVACSTGSACSSGSLLPSPVLQAMHKTGDILHSAMRFSLSPLLRVADIDEAARRIVQCVNRLRQAHDAEDGSIG